MQQEEKKCIVSRHCLVVLISWFRDVGLGIFSFKMSVNETLKCKFVEILNEQVREVMLCSQQS